MKIILLQDIKTLGQTGDVKEVAEGYARNFLLPKKMAEAATEEAMKNIQAKKEKKKALKEAELNKTKELAEKLKNKEITIKSEVKNGKLFGSVTARDIAKELKKENLEISEKSVILDGAIKKIGKYKVKIKLAEEIGADINLEITGN